MRILSIETSCDETAIALLDVKKTTREAKFTILGNALASQIDLHTQYGGVFPMMAKREHSKNIVPIFEKVLKQSGCFHLRMTTHQLSIKEKNKLQKILEREHDLYERFIPFIEKTEKPKIDVIAVTTGPGLEPALWVGINFAQALGAYWNIPVVAVNHMEGHILSIFPTKGKTFSVKTSKNMFPMLSLLVSGGHTEIVLISDWMKYKLLGQTRDDAAGEAFDKVARMLGLPYPGGPQISKLAKAERKIKKSSDTTITLPRPMIYSKDYDFSFSGLKTAVLYYIRDNGPLTEKMKSVIAREFEDAAVEVLTSKTIRAIKEYKIKTLIVGGGVSANTHLQKNITQKIKKESPETAVHFPIKSLSTDNALMIGIAGYFQYEKNDKKKSRPPLLKANGNLKL